jgi:diaminohydroxyphosphoribosylaminopyrimidine deaminase/5-amino-6-(5-phosphoribosylamino)uracil reductase
MLQQHEQYMQRCLQLAKLGAGFTRPNPMVGAVLVHDNVIIGEGYHRDYGKPHAEVNCIASVKDTHRHLIAHSTLYVSLEPCAHYGKTPPCTDLIIKNKIPKVVIGCTDPFEQVNGKGIEKLKAVGVEVITGILEKECIDLNKRFFVFHTKKRPYIILKWAQTVDKKIALNENKRLIISNEFTNRLVHKWRAEEAAILVGTNTVAIDDPLLTNRLWAGKNPVRLVIDKHLKLTSGAGIFNHDASTIVFNLHKTSMELNAVPENKVYYYKLNYENSLIKQVADACFKLNIQSILVEGGLRLLQSFIDEQLYDELRIITNENMFAGNGLPAPVFTDKLTQRNTIHVGTDKIEFLN